MRKGNSLRAFSGLSIGSKSNVDPSPRKPLITKQDDELDRVNYNIKSNDNEKRVQIQTLPISSRIDVNNDAEEVLTRESKVKVGRGPGFPLGLIIPVIVLLGWIIAAIQLSWYIYLCSEQLNAVDFKTISSDVDTYASWRNRTGNDDESTLKLLTDLVIVSIIVNCIYIIAHCALIYGAIKDNIPVCLGWCITVGICMLIRIAIIFIAPLTIFLFMGVELIFEAIAVGFVLLFVLDIRRNRILKEMKKNAQGSKTSLIEEYSTNYNYIPEYRKDNKIIPIPTPSDETFRPAYRTVKSNEEIYSRKQKPLEEIKSDAPIGQPKQKDTMKDEKEKPKNTHGFKFFSWKRDPVSYDSLAQPSDLWTPLSESKIEPAKPSEPSSSAKKPENPYPEESKPRKKKGRRRSSTGESLLRAMKRH